MAVMIVVWIGACVWRVMSSRKLMRQGGSGAHNGLRGAGGRSVTGRANGPLSGEHKRNRTKTTDHRDWLCLYLAVNRLTLSRKGI